MTDKPDLEGLEKLLTAATPGPWRIADMWGYASETIAAGHAAQYVAVAEMGNDGEPRHGRERDDAALIVAAVNALPTLLSTIRDLEARVEAMREALKNLVDAADEAANAENIGYLHLPIIEATAALESSRS